MKQELSQARKNLARARAMVEELSNLARDLGQQARKNLADARAVVDELSTLAKELELSIINAAESEENHKDTG